MARLDGIIRFKKRSLDDLRRELVDREEALAAVDTKLEALDAEEARESGNLGLEVTTISIGPYLKGVRVRRAALFEERAEREAEVEEQRDAVQLAFEELKTLELADERQKARAAATRAKQEQDEFDETALRSFTTPKGESR